MALEPESARLLALIRAAGIKPVSELTPAVVRKSMRTLARLNGPPADVNRVTDLSVTGPAGEIPIRAYRMDSGGEGPRPTVVYYHGGGWVGGDLDTADPFCRALAAESGRLIVSVNYRLAPEHRYPAAVLDAVAAVEGIIALGPSLGGDPSRLAVAGESAGGNLAAVVARTLRDRGGPPLAAQVLIYPVIDHRADSASYRDEGEDYLLTGERMRWYWRQYLPDASRGLDPDASPIFAESLSGLPPALILTAEHDPLRDEGEEYARAMADAGVDVTLRRLDAVTHGFAMLPGFLSEGRRAIDGIAEFLAAH